MTVDVRYDTTICVMLTLRYQANMKLAPQTAAPASTDAFVGFYKGRG